MPTINNMLSGTYSLYKSSYAAGTLFKNFNSVSNSNSDNQSSISKLWSSFNSFKSNADSSLSGLSMISSNVSSLVKSYDDTKNTFYSEFDDTMNNLQKSSDNIKNYNFNVGANALTTTETVDEDGNKTTTKTRSEELTAALKAIEQFASDYNDAIDFFNNNSDVSKRIGRMATMFSDTTYRSGNYNSIGLQIQSNGKIKIDEDKLTKVLTEDANNYAKAVENGDSGNFTSRVANILGKEGLAGKADNHIAVANGQRNYLFPSAETLIGKDLSSAAIYTGSSYRNMSNYQSVGNLINMMF